MHITSAADINLARQVWMANTEPTKTTASLSRWHRPRLYVTILAFYHIAFGIVGILSPCFFHADYPIYYFLYYPILVLYFALACVCTWLILKPTLHFVLPIALTILVSAAGGMFFIGSIVGANYTCSLHVDSMCQSAISPIYAWAGFFALASFITYVSLRGWRLCVRSLALR